LKIISDYPFNPRLSAGYSYFYFNSTLNLNKMKKKYIAAGVVGGAIGGLIAWKFLARESGISWDDVMQSVPNSDHSHFVEVDGMHVHFQEFGERHNPTLLLIHGYTASTYVWHTVAPILAENDFHVVAVDLIGFGYSSKPSWFDYSIASQARMIERFMDRLGIGVATLVGSSYGGAVASTVTLDYPERVEKLVLVDAVINDEAKNHPILRLANLRGIGEVITPFLVDSRMLLKHRMQGTIAPENHHLINKERIDSVIRPLKAKDAHHSVLTAARNWKASRIEEDAHLINQPTLIIWGDNDTVIKIHNGYKLHDSILNSRFVIFNQCGHVPQEEKPELFAEVVTDFCRSRKGKYEIMEDERMKVEI
jgi:pimeloyl-ACP methyl ester carboxylesterase